MIYILPRNSIAAFKIGTTKQDNLKRIKDLQTIYAGDFNLSESYLVKANEEQTTIDLEWQLKRDLRDFRYEINEEKKEGFSEFYRMEALPIVLNYIEFKAKAFEHLGFTIDKGIKVKRKRIQKDEGTQRAWNETQAKKFYFIFHLMRQRKENITYYEKTQINELGKELVTGILVTEDSYFLEQAFTFCHTHYFLGKDREFTNIDNFTEVTLPNDNKQGYLKTRETCKNRQIDTSTRIGVERKRINARVLYFQRVCKKELRETPVELRVL